MSSEPPASPSYFIATAAEARARVKQYPTRRIIDLTTLRSDQFIDRWDKVEAALIPAARRTSIRNRRAPV